MAGVQDTTIESPGGAKFNRFAAPLLSSLLFLSIFFLPVFGWAMNIFAPLPIIYYFFTRGRQSAHLAVIGSSLAIGVIVGLKLGLFYLFCYGLLALVMAEMINRRSTVEGIVTTAAAAAFVSSLFLVWLTIEMPISEAYITIQQQVEAIVSQSIEAYKKSGVSFEQLEIIEENSQWIAKWIVMLIPGVVMAAFLMLSVGNYIGYRLIQNRWPFLPRAGPDSILLWSPPDKTVFLAIAAGGMSLIPGTVIRTLGLNMMFVVGTIYSLTGFCIMHYFFTRARLPIFVRWAAYILLLLQPFLISGVALLGVFDLWFDFRKIRRSKAGKKEE